MASLSNGISVVNALSESLQLEIWRDGKVYRQRYERGSPVTELAIEGDTESTDTVSTIVHRLARTPSQPVPSAIR
ncbi:MAG: hypothetical protein AAFQ77_01870 [Myxococcota bacterium]